MANLKMQAMRLGFDPGDASNGFVPYVAIYSGSSANFGTSGSSASYGGSSTNFGQITCASAVAATLIIAANPSRVAVTLSNNQNGLTWISNTSASTTASSTGFKMQGGNVPLTLHTQSALYGLASSGTTAITSYIEEAL